ncbi:MAG: acetyl-CoA carboxylase carboxyl transferase subunit beta [Chloroflexi bacterium]|nr:acetyl-CoA carboxylase carboxyl transferase subunit beta [Chloroflexota bacterium]
MQKTQAADAQVREAKPRQFWNRLTLGFARVPVLLRLRQPILCPRCKTDLTTQPLYRRWLVCDQCGFHFSISARARINHLVDPRSFREFSSAVLRREKAPPQRKAILTGVARLHRRPLVIAAFDFQILGGTMSVLVGEEITRAIEYAAEHALPFIVSTATGGVRIQEGIPALLQMAKTTQAIQQFQQGRQPFIAVLTHPTTGGVYASFSNLADIILAEPGAVIGFAGPRVAEALTHEKLAAESHRAESAYKNGMIDAIVARQNLRATLTRILPVSPAEPLPELANQETASAEIREQSAEEITALSRRTDRPTSLDYIKQLCADFVELHGDRLLGDDPAIVGGLAQFENQPLILIAQQRKPVRPEGYHKAERLIHLAERFHLPIVTMIDTPGADPGFESEQHGIAGAIAHCLATLLQTNGPTISVIIGEGTSGGALALAVTDRVLMMENATFSVISAEGASVILFGDTSHAAETVAKLGNRAIDLQPLGIVDRIIAEPKAGAHAQPDAAIAAVEIAIHATLAELQKQNDDERLEARRARYRGAGLNTFSTPSTLD